MVSPAPKSQGPLTRFATNISGRRIAWVVESHPLLPARCHWRCWVTARPAFFPLPWQNELSSPLLQLSYRVQTPATGKCRMAHALFFQVHSFFFVVLQFSIVLCARSSGATRKKRQGPQQTAAGHACGQHCAAPARGATGDCSRIAHKITCVGMRGSHKAVAYRGVPAEFSQGGGECHAHHVTGPEGTTAHGPTGPQGHRHRGTRVHRRTGIRTPPRPRFPGLVLQLSTSDVDSTLQTSLSGNDWM